jgi:hypothetical protein
MYSPEDKALIYEGVSIPFYSGREAGIRLWIALEVLDFADGKKTLQEVVENINEFKEK